MRTHIHCTDLLRPIALATVVATASVAASAQTADGVIENSKPTTLASTGPVTEEQRTQLFRLASEVSMRNRLMIAGQGPKRVADVLASFQKEADDQGKRFDAHETLSGVWASHRSFLVASKPALIAAIRDFEMPSIPIDPTENPEAALAAAFVVSAVEIRRQSIIWNWHQQHDVHCRRQYERLMPLIRRAAKGKELKDGGVTVEPAFAHRDWAYLRAVNTTNRKLTNVTLKITLESLDGRKCDHYFFLPAWYPNLAKGEVVAVDGEEAFGHEYFIRISSEWAMIDAHATAFATVDLYSDQVVATDMRSVLSEQFPGAARALLDELGPQIDSNERLAEAIRQLDRASRSLSNQRDEFQLVSEAAAAARKRLAAYIKSIDDAIKDNREKKKWLLRGGDPGRDFEDRPPAKGPSDPEIKKVDEEISRLQKLKQDVTAGRV